MKLSEFSENFVKDGLSYFEGVVDFCYLRSRQYYCDIYTRFISDIALN